MSLLARGVISTLRMVIGWNCDSNVSFDEKFIQAGVALFLIKGVGSFFNKEF